MTSPTPEGAARTALERGKRVAEMPMGDKKVFAKANVDRYYAIRGPALARAYLDLLAERERTRATLETMPAPVGFDARNCLEIVDAWEREGIAQVVLSRLNAGPSREERNE